MQPESKLTEIITDMSIRATEAAHKAWAECLKTGVAGNLKLPVNNPAAKKYAEQFFMTGYGMALIDHTMTAAERMRAAQHFETDTRSTI